ncbi:MAG: putative selenate reductase subunit YgfK [Bacteroidales bacterium]
MSDKFTPIPLPRLLALTLSEIRNNRFMGLPGSLFFIPKPADPFKMERYGELLETPVGVAAGPHTQLSVNIIAAWLCGARYIELKTIQTLDELEVSKPCIDMQDEGYNCEWSQELKVEQSFHEYLNAWIIIHILRKELGFDGPVGTLFNMSVGYNLEGILNENVQWFFTKMQDCSKELSQAKDSIRNIYKSIDEIGIPSCISNHITLSTMHGCPPDEIGKIGLYLINEKKLHTTIKLNPTLLGPVDLRSLLNDKMGFSADIPDLAFEHDLKYPDALKILNMLGKASLSNGLHFSVKLTNTLESHNNKQVFSEKEGMMYMSGRALHPISVSVARKLQNDLGGALDVSFSAGVDCFNIADILSCGMKPVTVCSDLLKPGGYGRLWQYMNNLRKEFEDKHAKTINEYICKIAGTTLLSVQDAALLNLNNYADRVGDNLAYHKTSFTDPSIKTNRPLGFFDCIHAPCTDTCPTHQGIPDYMYYTSQGEISSAFETIFDTNPFPSVTGMVCDHLCQGKCTRINYDEALHIREIKRFVAESMTSDPSGKPFELNGRKAAIIGAGPAGLSCAWFLKRAGFEVDVYEQKNIAGGMVSSAIPSFRLTNEAIERDIQRILSSGVNLVDNYKINKENFEAIRLAHDVVFLATGAQKSAELTIDGINSQNVLDPLQFLFDVRQNLPTGLGKHVVIIGGGNTAMDAARTAYRLVGKEGKVTIVYRRSIKEMPADKGEIQAVLDEGIEIIELTNPESIMSSEGRVNAILCSRNILALKDKDGRPVPVKVPYSEFTISCDTIIPAIGQKLDIDFTTEGDIKTINGSYKNTNDRLYIGGDALRGASTAINAIADGRKAAAEIIADLSVPHPAKTKQAEKNINLADLLHRKSIRQYGISPKETPLYNRRNFDLVMASLSPEEARKEASRCLQCDEICNVCASVCPNLANFSFEIEPVKYHLQKAVLTDDASVVLEADRIFNVEQPHQVLNIRDLCNECANCETFCPSSGKPYADKPGLCLSIQTLNQEGEGYFLSQLPDRQVLIYKNKENIKTLSLVDGKYLYETDQVKATINPDDFSIQDVRFLTPCVTQYHFTFAAEMSIIMKGAMQLVF